MIGRTWLPQWCPACEAITEARLELAWDRGHLVGDVSTCPCGRVLWIWHAIPNDERAALPAAAHPRGTEQLSLF